MSQQKQNYLHGATILTVGVVIMKILGGLYKIPLGNLLGTATYGYFAAAYNIYAVMLTVSTAGLPVALSRLISEANTLGEYGRARQTFNIAMALFVAMGAVLSAVMFFFPTELAIAMNKVEATQSILALSPSVLLVCIASAYRGYIQGHSNMIPTTVSQVLEVFAKVVTGLALAWYFVKTGKSGTISSAGAIFGVTIGSLVSAIYMFAYYRKHYSKALPQEYTKTVRNTAILKDLLKIGIPITLGASVMSLISLLDTSLVNFQLASNKDILPFSPDELFGTYSLLLTLYNLPVAFITPLTISVVPAISAAIAVNNHREAADISSSSIRMTSIIAVPMGIGLAALAAPIISTIYPRIENNTGPLILFLLGIASIFVCVLLTSNSILQASGNERLPIISMLVGGAVKIVVTWVLVGDPEIHIYGAPVGTLACFVVMAGLNWIFMRKSLVVKPRLSRTVLLPLICGLIMGGAAWGSYGLFQRFINLSSARLSMVISMGLSIILAIIIYLVLIIVTRAITLEDMKLIPKGEKVGKMLKIK
ncbi:polysaccharide biosynthesis protein [Clostridiaceae bacterium OttesenSCG-928-D20]|nr:polysaccharide biosynthesis protein [Clostridiaceae bacterium OttesenSCG-928-D20]